MTERDPEGNFLQRWSQNKIKQAEPDVAPPAADLVVGPDVDPDVTPDANPDTELVAAGGETEITEDEIANLPDIETLGKDSDYTGFMREGVPVALQNLALRKLWLSDPVLANLDGLNDYDEDFGKILREGAKYMKRLVDAGEKITRPGADPEEDKTEETDEEKLDEQQDGVPIADAGNADAGNADAGIADAGNAYAGNADPEIAEPEVANDGEAETPPEIVAEIDPDTGEEPRLG
jgi:hypothetical protein